MCSIHVDQTYRIFGLTRYSSQFLGQVLSRLFLELMCQIYMPFTPTKYLDVYVEYMSRIYVKNIHVGHTYRIFGNSSHTLHLLKFIFYAEYLCRTYILHISIVIFVHNTYGQRFIKCQAVAHVIIVCCFSYIPYMSNMLSRNIFQIYLYFYLLNRCMIGSEHLCQFVIGKYLYS